MNHVIKHAELGGLILDCVGALIVAISTHIGLKPVKSENMFGENLYADDIEYSVDCWKWITLFGWLLIILGFSLQAYATL